MIKYEILMLKEWHARFLKIKHRWDVNLSPFRIFCSFLHMDSLELIWMLTSEEILNHFKCYYNQFNSNHEKEPLLRIIFFPVSKNQIINQKFLSEFSYVLLQIHSKSNFDEVRSSFSDIIENAIKVVEKNQYMLNYLPFNEKMSILHGNNSEKMLNTFLFGQMAAKYLEDVKIFPRIYLNDHQYLGIPINMIIEEFVLNILLMEFQEEKFLKPVGRF